MNNKTKIKYCSDLHVDINTRYYDLTDIEIMQSLNLYDIDILVIAGDTAEYPKNLRFVDFVSKHYPNLKIVEVGGNHLYYSCGILHMTIDEINHRCKKHNESNPNYFFLENDTIVLNNIKFIGTTLWTKLGERAGIQMKCVQALNDFRHIIRHYPRYINAKDYSQMCEKARKFIVKEVNNTPEAQNCIVITHHAPFVEYMDDVSHAFGIDLSKTISRFKNRPLAWIFGHNHINKECSIYIKNQNKPLDIICNQFGYAGETEFGAQFNARKTFSSTKVLEV